MQETSRASLSSSIIPGGFLVVGQHRLSDVELKERWLRTRPKVLNQALQSPHQGAVANAGGFFDGLRRCMEVYASESGTPSAWEFNFEHGQIRCGDLEVCRRSGRAHDVGRKGTSNGLRLSSIDELVLPAEILVNPVASFLDSFLNFEVGWQSTAPANTQRPERSNKKNVKLRVSSCSCGHCDSGQARVDTELLAGG